MTQNIIIHLQTPPYTGGIQTDLGTIRDDHTVHSLHSHNEFPFYSHTNLHSVDPTSTPQSHETR
jgi:hypothetical protein